jgi:transketolase
VETRDRPVALVLSRQKLPTLERAALASADGLKTGAYVLADAADGKPDVILIASGSEVALIVAARQKLLEKQIRARIVSMPSWELFDAQSQEYRDSVLPRGMTARLAVEAGISQGWPRYTGERGEVLAVDRFGASAPGEVLLREYGFTVENVCARALALLGRQ